MTDQERIYGMTQHAIRRLKRRARVARWRRRGFIGAAIAAALWAIWELGGAL